MRTIRFRAWLCLAAQVTLLVDGCRTPVAKVAPNKPIAVAPATTPAPPQIAASGRAQVAIDPSALEGKVVIGSPDPRQGSAPIAVETLAPDATTALLSHLEAMPDLSAAPAPIVRAPTQPPARSGTITPIEFVVPRGKSVGDAPIPPSVEHRSLALPQIQPTGEVPLEAEIRVRFEEPMVPVAEIGDLTKAPATISPAAVGRWRWLDTRVLVFTSSQLAKATDYTVTVPAGFKSVVSGATLAVPVTAVFSTRPNQLVRGFPNAKLRPDSPLVVDLDQDFDQAAIGKLLTLKTEKHVAIPFKVITIDDAEKLWTSNPSIDFTETHRFMHPLVLAPKTAWPAGITMQVELAKGASSLEGPRISTRESFERFEVAAPFTFEGIECDDKTPALSGNVCSAHGYLAAQFSNSIWESSYRSALVQIDGEPFEDHVMSGATVDMSGPGGVGRKLGVTIGNGLVDIYGQPFVGTHHASFSVGPQHWQATMNAHTGMYILDPRFEIPQWEVTAEAIPAIHVELYKVEPKDYFAYQQYEEAKRPLPPGKRVFEKSYAVGGRWGSKLRVDLRPGLDGGLGHVIAVATAPGGNGREVEKRYVAWIQVSKLATSMRIDGERLSAWVARTDPKQFLEPIDGATLAIVRDGSKEPARTGTTDATGHAVLDLLDASPKQPPPNTLLTIASGSDRSFVDIGSAERSVRRDEARWYVTDDRFLYKPGEKVYVKGWVRWTDTGINPKLALPSAGEVVTYNLHDGRGKELARGTAPLGDQGGFDIEVQLPATPDLGTSYFTLTTRKATYTHPIQIQEFRTPAFSVALNDDVAYSGARSVILGEGVEMRVESKYYAGGGLAGADVDWSAKLTPATYRPPGWDRYAFTPPVTRPERSYRYQRHRPITATAKGTLSGASTAAVQVGVAAVVPYTPSILEVDSTVADVDRMHIRASSRKILVHPSAYYVGIRARPDHEDTEMQLVVSDIDGALVSGVPIEVTIEGVLGSERWRSDPNVVDTQHCAIASSTTPVSCAWKRTDPLLAYTATAKIADPRGRANVTQFDVPWDAPEQATATLSIAPDKTSYKPGDVAKIAIHSTLVPATAIVSFARQGVISQRKIAITGATTIVELPIESAYIENITVSVDRWSEKPKPDAKDAATDAAKTSKLPFPKHDSMSVDLKVDRESARLAMTAKSLRPIVGPGEDATYEVTVRNDDLPVANAEVALIVVDEAILALAGKHHADPLEPFYKHVSSGDSEYETYNEISDEGETLDEPPGFSRYKLDELGMGRSGFGVGGGALGSASNGSMGFGVGAGVVAARKDFRANAVFSPRLHTDANGVVRLTVKMPDNLTRFRIIALATANTYEFGMVENAVTTQRKLNARMVPPRFLTQGDAFSLPVVVQNLDDKPRTIEVAVRAANLASKGPMGKRVTVPSGQRTELRFDFATKGRGRAAIQAIAISGTEADASNTEIQVYEPATTETFATYGIVDDKPQFEQLAVPRDIFPEVGGVDVEIASTQLQALTDAYWYIYAYPYECAEQRSARMLATAAMGKILDAFQSQGRPTSQQIAAQRVIDLAKLHESQNGDGGWGYFSSMHSDPYVSMQVLSALAASSDRSSAFKLALAYVTKITDDKIAHLAKTEKLPAADRKHREELPYEVALVAAGLSSLASTGLDVRARAVRLHKLATSLDAYPIDAKARVLAVHDGVGDATVRAKLLADLLSATHETAAGATVTAAYVESERLLLVSSAKTTALALDAIMRESPTQSIIAKLSRGLLAQREHGRWRTTQENLSVLQAMRRYFDTYEKATPNYTGKLWFGAAAYAEQSFVGRSDARGEIHVAWPTLGLGSSHDVTVAKDGTGRMYYRMGITYAPKKVDLPALDAGFVVRRTYTALDDDSDVQHRSDGTWHIKLGARVLVQIEATNTTRRDNAALVDPLPAGFEIVNAALAVAERPADEKSDWSWNFVNLRDNRAEAFASTLYEGAHAFQYTVRATTPGAFVAAPAKAEEMYAPETFGRSNGATVVIE